MKRKSKMRTEKQVRSEMEHQKELAKKALKMSELRNVSMTMYRVYESRIHLLSWVLGDSDTF